LVFTYLIEGIRGGDEAGWQEEVGRRRRNRRRAEERKRKIDDAK
jgi:hypothetical protein